MSHCTKPGSILTNILHRVGFLDDPQQGFSCTKMCNLTWLHRKSEWAKPWGISELAGSPAEVGAKVEAPRILKSQARSVAERSRCQIDGCWSLGCSSFDYNESRVLCNPLHPCYRHSQPITTVTAAAAFNALSRASPIEGANVRATPTRRSPATSGLPNKRTWVSTFASALSNPTYDNEVECPWPE